MAMLYQFYNATPIKYLVEWIFSDRNIPDITSLILFYSFTCSLIFVINYVEYFPEAISSKLLISTKQGFILDLKRAGGSF